MGVLALEDRQRRLGGWATLSEQNINRDGYTGEFQFSIDTQDYEEGEHDLYLQVISGKGLKSEVERRTIDIDNLPQGLTSY